MLSIKADFIKRYRTATQLTEQDMIEYLKDPQSLVSKQQAAEITQVIALELDILRKNQQMLLAQIKELEAREAELNDKSETNEKTEPLKIELEALLEETTEEIAALEKYQNLLNQQEALKTSIKQKISENATNIKSKIIESARDPKAKQQELQLHREILEAKIQEKNPALSAAEVKEKAQMAAATSVEVGLFSEKANTTEHPAFKVIEKMLDPDHTGDYSCYKKLEELINTCGDDDKKAALIAKRDEVFGDTLERKLSDSFSISEKNMLILSNSFLAKESIGYGIQTTMEKSYQQSENADVRENSQILAEKTSNHIVENYVEPELAKNSEALKTESEQLVNNKKQQAELLEKNPGLTQKPHKTHRDTIECTERSKEALSKEASHHPTQPSQG